MNRMQMPVQSQDKEWKYSVFQKSNIKQHRQVGVWVQRNSIFNFNLSQMVELMNLSKEEERFFTLFSKY